MSYCYSWKKSILYCVHKSQIVPIVGRVGQLILNNSVNIIEVLRFQKPQNPIPNPDNSPNQVDTDWVGESKVGDQKSTAVWVIVEVGYLGTAYGLFRTLFYFFNYPAGT